ncbi:MAG: hypothetical protein KDC98_01425 [Planctomycetes bacterium]|nr:hypothetical protein [Planctomycetota bacterium]
MRPLHSILPVAVLVATAAAQDQATTLAAACDRADLVVTATVVRATDPSPQWHRMEWRVDQALKGDPGAEFSLLEPAGACCGRSLFALAVGDRRLLFLTRTGRTLHPFGGSRGVVPTTVALTDHVRRLLAATTTAGRTALLARSLDAAEPRIAHDAAHALAAMPTLDLGGDDRDRACAALRLALTRGQTTAASLIEVIARTADITTLDEVLPIYLAETRDDRARMLRQGLARVQPELLADRLPAHLAGDRHRELRAAELLRQAGGQTAVAAMRQLLSRTGCPRVKLCLTEGLLAAGTGATSLRRDVPQPVLELARRRTSKATLRTIDPTIR